MIIACLWSGTEEIFLSVVDFSTEDAEIVVEGFFVISVLIVLVEISGGTISVIFSDKVEPSSEIVIGFYGVELIVVGNTTLF